MIPKGKFSLILCILIVILNVFGLSEAQTNENTLGRDVERFGIRMLYEFDTQNPKRDIIFSPFSIENCLSMALMGAEGQTADEMNTALFIYRRNRFNVAYTFYSVLDKYQKSSVLRIANKMYAMKDYEVNDIFSNILKNYFFSSVDSLNFSENVEAAQTINSWVEHETNNKIKDLVNADSLDKDTRLVLVNAIYFQGNWVEPFDESNTYETDFFLANNSTTKVQMMFSNKERNYVRLPELDASAVELPYKDSDLSFVIVLPNKRYGLAELERKMHFTPLTNIVNRMERFEINLHIPKFKAQFRSDLNAPLEHMGMRRMFTRNAQFGQMLKSGEGLEVSSVIHQAFIEVNERGTEAAAATEMGFSNRIAAEAVFIADHGFLYYIRSKDGINFFQGKQAYFN